MKLTKKTLKQLIKEELESAMDPLARRRRGLNHKKLIALIMKNIPASILRHARQNRDTVKEDPLLALESISGACSSLWSKGASKVKGACNDKALAAAIERVYDLSGKLARKATFEDFNEFLSFVPSRPRPMALRATRAWAKYCKSHDDSDF